MPRPLSGFVGWTPSSVLRLRTDEGVHPTILFLGRFLVCALPNLSSTTARRITRSLASALNDANRLHASDLLRQARFVDDVDNEVHVLVGIGLFFGEASPALSPCDDPSAEQFFVDATAF